MEGLYCVGDASTSGYELTPVAIAAGRRLADRLFGGMAEAKLDYEMIPTVVFSHPPIGTIGLTEPQARELYGDGAIKVKKARFTPMLYALNESDGLKVNIQPSLHSPTASPSIVSQEPHWRSE